MISTLLMLLVVVLAGWAVATATRAPRPGADPQVTWEHWLEASRMRPVIPRTRAVVEAATAAQRRPVEVARAALGRAADGAMVVVAQLVSGETLIGARRDGPLPAHGASVVNGGWQLVVSSHPVDRAWDQAGWLRNGPATIH